MGLEIIRTYLKEGKYVLEKRYSIHLNWHLQVLALLLCGGCAGLLLLEDVSEQDSRLLLLELPPGQHGYGAEVHHRSGVEGPRYGIPECGGGMERVGPDIGRGERRNRDFVSCRRVTGFERSITQMTGATI